MQVFNVQGMTCGHCVKAVTRAVQEQDVEVRGIEAPQDGIDRLDDVLVAEIEALRRAGRVVRPAYAHLRLQNHAVAQ